MTRRMLHRARRFSPLAAALTAPADYRVSVLAYGPARYWRLGDAGATFADSSANNVPAVQTFGNITHGVAGAIAGDADGAVLFVSSSRIVAPAVDYETVTALCWARWTSTSDSALIEHWDGTASRYPFVLRVNRNGNPGRVGFGCWDGTHNPFAESANGFNDGAWHFLAGTRSARGTLSVYVDGVLRGTAADTTTTTTANGEHLNLGIRGNGAAPYLGGLDEAAIVQAVLDATAVAALYLKGIGD